LQVGGNSCQQVIERVEAFNALVVAGSCRIPNIERGEDCARIWVRPARVVAVPADRGHAVPAGHVDGQTTGLLDQKRYCCKSCG
jgi:hypothetical protein